MPPASDPGPSRPEDGPFPVRHIASVEARPPEAQWLIDELWALGAVGILGGAPKSGKTWLAAELATAVATGKEALGRFRPRAKGPVLFYGAEDDQPALRNRFNGLAERRGVRLEDVPVFLLDVRELRLDRARHLERLRGTIAALRPRLLVLDPFVRLARIDENSAADVSAVLGSLRAIQRDFDLAVMVAHHMRKSPSPSLGQQLRGSGDFAAWADSSLYLTRRTTGIVLTAEHRGAKAPPPIHLALETRPVPHLVEVDPAVKVPEKGPLEAAILDRLASAPRPLSTVELRDALRIRKATVVAALAALRDRGTAVRQGDGWALARD